MRTVTRSCQLAARSCRRVRLRLPRPRGAAHPTVLAFCRTGSRRGLSRTPRSGPRGVAGADPRLVKIRPTEPATRAAFGCCSKVVGPVSHFSSRAWHGSPTRSCHSRCTRAAARLTVERVVAALVRGGGGDDEKADVHGRRSRPRAAASRCVAEGGRRLVGDRLPGAGAARAAAARGARRRVEPERLRRGSADASSSRCAKTRRRGGRATARGRSSPRRRRRSCRGRARRSRASSQGGSAAAAKRVARPGSAGGRRGSKAASDPLGRRRRPPRARAALAVVRPTSRGVDRVFERRPSAAREEGRGPHAVI